jgi:hypothetical protein
LAGRFRQDDSTTFSFAESVERDVAKLREHDRVLKVANRGIAGS